MLQPLEKVSSLTVLSLRENSRNWFASEQAHLSITELSKGSLILYR